MLKAILTRRVESGYVASDADGNRTRVTEYSHIQGIENRHAAAALALCKKMGWTGELECNYLRGNEYVFTFRNQSNPTIFKIGA